MKNNLKLSYIFGVFMGIFLSLLGIVFLYGTKQINFDKKQVSFNEQIHTENVNLKSKLEEKEEEIKKLNKKLKSSSQIKVDTGSKVTFSIDKGMTNDKIADLIVKNGVYNHKNDILMVMELIGFNRAKYSEKLQDYGYISSAYEFNKALKEIETRGYSVADALYSSGLVKDKASFMKIVYLLDINTSIKYGSKEFEKNSSLRQVCDVLIN